MPSTAIHDYDYDADTERLTVTFTTGRVYIYEDVSEAVAADFDNAASKGRYFNAHIRDRYPYYEVILSMSERIS